MSKDPYTIIQQRQEELACRLDPRWQPRTEKPVFASMDGSTVYEMSDRTKAINYGGIGLIQQLVQLLGLPEKIDKHLDLFKIHMPYHESDHILNIVYNLISGGQCIEDIQLRRQDINYLDALGAHRIPHATTAGDFLRRFDQEAIMLLLDVLNNVRREIWLKKPEEMREVAIIDVDGTLLDTNGDCKEGADFSYKGTFGYGPLVISLANTGEVLFIINRGGNRPSHDGAPGWLDAAAAWAKSAGFKKVRFRGDTDFSLTEHFDRWDDGAIEFAFGIDAHPAFVRWAESLDESSFMPLERRQKDVKTDPRSRPFNFREAAVVARKYKNFRLQSEHVAEIEYKPKKSDRTYRMIILRKNISVEKGEDLLFDQIRYFFYVTNIDGAEMSAEEIIFENNARCNQENLIEQMKNGVRAFKAPAVEFNANWAYMVIGSLAWNLKVWLGLTLPEDLYPGFDPSEVLRMEFRSFLRNIIEVPTQIVRTGRRLVFRLLSCPKTVRLILDGSAWIRQQSCA